eukprot:gene2922-3361_t
MEDEIEPTIDPKIIAIGNQLYPATDNQVVVEEEAMMEDDENHSEYPNRSGVIQYSQIKNNRAQLEELETILKKKLDVGIQSRKLYIKNLTKQVDSKDLEYIYGRYFSSQEEMTAKMEIVHYKEGRMKNQAFITFPSEKMALDALTETQGYILKDKPLII